MGLAILSIFLIRDLYQSIKEETDLKVQQVKLAKKEKMIKELRQQKHDFSNHLQTIYSMLQLGKEDEVKEYIKSLNQELKTIQPDLKTQEKETVLTSLLLSIEQEAEEAGVEFEYELEPGLRATDYSLSELFRIASNLIENAIEATQTYSGEK